MIELSYLNFIILTFIVIAAFSTFLCIIITIIKRKSLINQLKDIKEAEEKKNLLYTQSTELRAEIDRLLQSNKELLLKNSSLNEQQKNNCMQVENEMRQYEKFLQENLDKKMSILQEKESAHLREISYLLLEKFFTDIEIQKKEKERIADDEIKDYQQIVTIQIEEFKKQLEEYRSKTAAARARFQEEEIERQKNYYYTLNLTEDTLNDIEKLQQIEPYLKQAEVLNKLIYKTYFEKAYTDLVGRVLGKEKITGIYLITNLLNHKTYVGQAVDVAERWKQHIKRGLGAETVTQNKLYPAMKHEGVWNFSFELIEQCDKAQLNDREKYWQDFYGAKEFGYSIK